MKILKKIIKVVFSLKTTIIALLVAQIAFLVYAFFSLSEQYTYLNIVFIIVSVALTVYILNKPENPAYKLAWIIPLLAMPLFTTVAYFILMNQYGTKKVRDAHNKKCANTKPFLKQKEPVLNSLNIQDKNVYHLATYVDKFGGYPVYQNSSVTYFDEGMEKFKAMKRELKKAKHFIFMEYFIIDQGDMWSEIEQILIDKAKQGVDVRLMYDGMGSQSLLPWRYDKKLRKQGIRCHVFNPFRPMISTIQNNRDHRKILVIDGHTAFTGGVNLADEYINIKERFGHWKDSAIMVKGEAVWNFTMMFFQMWEILDGETVVAEYDDYRPEKYQIEKIESDGFVMPYGDSPLDNENVGEMVYMNIINSAKDYVYITTPYLLIDNEMVTALGYAAKSGVDVRIIVPGIPDKWYVKSIGWSYYRELIELGVKIYEYNGFIHAKNFVSDDTTAVVGSINLDFRSLYLHFECASYMYKMPCVLDVKKDFLYTLENNCTPITMETCAKRPWISRTVSAVLRTFAPLL